MNLKIHIGIKSLSESNTFLRALWANIRNEFGKCAWQYSPYRDGSSNTIFIGHMDISLIENKSVSCSLIYKEKGSIQSIQFYSDVEDAEIENRLRNCVNRAKNDDSIKTFNLKFNIESLHAPIANYTGENFSIQVHNKSNVNSITVRVHGYDLKDAESNLLTIRDAFLCILSVFTNSVFLSPYNKSEFNGQGINKSNIFFGDYEWIDGYPIKEGKHYLLRQCLTFLDLVAEDYLKLSPHFNKLIAACKQFHTGRKLDAQINDQLFISSEEIDEKGGAFHLHRRDSRLREAVKFEILNSEIVNVLYVSTLETVAATFPFEKKVCVTCNQPVFSISKRVEALVKKYLGDFVAQTIKHHYNSRSKFVHEGWLNSKYNYSGVSIPQLDPSTSSGCHVQSSTPDINLREFTSFILRQVIVEKINAISNNLDEP
jgi:hypothetical protein